MLNFYRLCNSGIGRDRRHKIPVNSKVILLQKNDDLAENILKNCKKVIAETWFGIKESIRNDHVILNYFNNRVLTFN